MANFLSNVLGSSLNIFSKKEQSVVGIDIGSVFLKVVQLKQKKGRAVLETYGELALGPYAGLAVGQATNLPVAKISEVITDIFREANVTTTSSAVSLPLRSSLMSLMEMPAVDEKQLNKMVPIEARRYIPVPTNEVTLDWWIVPKDEQESNEDSLSEIPQIRQVDGGGFDAQKEIKQDKNHVIGKKIDVLVVAIHNDTIKRYQNIINGVGLNNSFMELEVFSTARSTFGNHVAPIMIMDLGGGSTKLAILEHGIIKGQHIINRGSQEITLTISQALGVSVERAEELKRKVGLLGLEGDEKQVSEVIESTLTSVFAEASTVLLNYQRKHNRSIKNIVLTGGGALMRGVYDFAGAQTETEIMFADSFSKVDAPAFLAPVLKDASPEFSVALGLALRKLQEIS